MKRNTLNALIVAAGYLLSRVLGLARDVIISAQFGTSPELAAFRASFGIIDLIYLVVAGGALGSAFLPVFAEHLEQGRPRDAWHLATALLNLALAALVVACGLIWLLAEPLVAATVGRGFAPEVRALTVDVLRVMLLQPLLLGLGGLAKATLESFGRFALPAIGSNLYNLGIIGGALLAPWLGISGLVWGVNVGAALFLLVQLPGLRQVGAAYVAAAPGAAATLRDATLGAPGVRRVLRLLGPRLFGQSAWQVNMIAIVSLASTLGAAAVAANAYALQLMMLPHGLIALSLATVIFPQLARRYAAGELAALREEALGAVRSVLFLALPAAALLGVLALPLLRALFQRGAFDAASAQLTAEALAAYALGLAGFAAAEIVVRAFYAMQDTRTPVAVAFGAVLLNVALGWSLLRLGLGIGGLGLAFSVANLAEALALLLLLGRRLGGLGAPFARGVAAMLLAALACALVAGALLAASAGPLAFLRPGDTYDWPGDFVALALWLGGASAVSLGAYAAVAALLRLPELDAAAARLRRALRRPRQT